MCVLRDRDQVNEITVAGRCGDQNAGLRDKRPGILTGCNSGKAI